MNWNDYRKAVQKTRQEYDVYEYTAVLLLGINVEYGEYHKHVYLGNDDKQVEHYGNLLYNVAELANITEEYFAGREELRIVGDVEIFEHQHKQCVSIVKELYFEQKYYTYFMSRAYDIAKASETHYLTSQVSIEAMEISINNLTQRGV